MSVTVRTISDAEVPAWCAALVAVFGPLTTRVYTRKS
jgi:hypothetical protein